MNRQTVGDTRRQHMANRNRGWAADLRELAACGIIDQERRKALDAAADLLEAGARMMDQARAC